MSLFNRIKPIHLLIVLVFMIIPMIILLLSFFSQSREKKEESSAPTQPVTAAISPRVLPPGVETMEIIRAAPFAREDIFYLPIQPVELTFTDEVLPESVKYTIEPKVDVKVEQGSIPNAIIISPLKWWEDGTTKVTILKTTTSKNGAVLPASFVYEIQISLPPAPDPESEENY